MRVFWCIEIEFLYAAHTAQALLRGGDDLVSVLYRLSAIPSLPGRSAFGRVRTPSKWRQPTGISDQVHPQRNVRKADSVKANASTILSTSSTTNWAVQWARPTWRRAGCKAISMATTGRPGRLRKQGIEYEIVDNALAKVGDWLRTRQLAWAGGQVAARQTGPVCPRALPDPPSVGRGTITRAWIFGGHLRRFDLHPIVA